MHESCCDEEKNVPRPGFPRNLREFQAQFATQEARLANLADCRWPEGFVGPRCGSRSAHELAHLRRGQCAHYRGRTSVIAGSILRLFSRPALVAMSNCRGVDIADDPLRPQY